MFFNDGTVADDENIIRVNINGTVRMTKIVLPQMAER